MSEFTYAELFAGIGGFRMALDKMGGECVFASEIDKFAKQSYTALYGNDHLYGDITEIEAEDIPNHDVLVGGFPCQAFSVAGKREGFEDTRGTLFFEIARIAAEKKPKALLLENVKGLVNHDKGRTLDVMIETLNNIGYIVDFNVLNSKYFGVPQNRERIFIVAIREDLIESEPFNEESTTGQAIIPKGKRRIGEWAEVFNFDFPKNDKVTTRLRDILESNVDEKYYLDEDKTAKLVAQLEEKDKTVGTIGHHPFSKRFEFKGYNSEISPSLIATDYKAPKTVLEFKPQMLGHVDIKGNDSIKRVYDPVGVSPTLTTMGGGHREPKIAIESAYHFPTPNDVNNTLRTGGKGSLTAKHNYEHIAEPVAQEVRPVLTPDRAEKRQNGRRFKEVGEESFTITAQDRHGVALGVPPRYRIRKLTPLECWRLQGFSDLAHETVKAAGVSDSQRYKQAGNAVTVSVIEAIATQLIPLITSSATATPTRPS